VNRREAGLSPLAYLARSYRKRDRKPPALKWGMKGRSRLRARAFGATMRRRTTFQCRRYPTKAQQRLLDAQGEEYRWLSTHLLAERRDAWEQRQESLRLDEQQATLRALKAVRPLLAGVHAQVAPNVAVRLDLAFQARQTHTGGRLPPFSAPPHGAERRRAQTAA
jgi:hypothetical protein